MDSEDLLVIGVVVELQSRQSLGIVGDRPNLLVRTTNRENVSDGIVGGVCLYNDWSVWNLMDEDRSRGEGGVTGVTEVPGNTFAGEAGQRSDDTEVIIYKMPVKVGKSEEGLDILDLARFRPVLYGFHFLWRHSKSGG